MMDARVKPAHDARGSRVEPAHHSKNVVSCAPSSATKIAINSAGSVTAYVTKGEIRSQLAGGPVETFGVGQSFFEPPGAVHLVSANASTTEPAELIAIFVADEGAQLTTLLK